MRKQFLQLTLCACAFMLLCAGTMSAQRAMENLGRGMVGVRTGTSGIFVSWRLLGLDPAGIGFNLYRSAAGGTAVKLNGAVLTAGTNFTDTTANITLDNAYYVKPVISGTEQAASGSYTVKANTPAEPCIVVPLVKPDSGYHTKFVWVGDLDGDGEFDFVIDRLSQSWDPNVGNTTTNNQFLEAYKRDGTRLWSIDMGPNSRTTYNISPGSATLSMGMYDGADVYDLNGDGKAEVVLKVADGVVLGDGTVFHNADPNKQFLALIDGLTGKLLSSIAFPTDYYAKSGRYGTQLAIAYLDGKTPSVIGWLRNRNADKSFNDIMVAWHVTGTTISQTWKLPIPAGTPNIAGDHQMVIADVDGDGKDEICPGNYLINPNGTIRYTLGADSVDHGDRHYMTKMDPNRKGLQGYGIQQYNPTGLAEYYYDASTGEMLWKHMFSTNDVSRGLVGHIDPRYKGWEAWSWWGIWFAPTNTQLTVDPQKPYPCHTFWWDGDLLSENLNDWKFEKWDYVSQTTGRMLSSYKYENAVIADHNPMLSGDIFGDWRTEVVEMSSDMSKIVIFTTDIPSDNRIYTMAQNPEHRCGMTVKGYYQSPLVDYYLGTGMDTPPVPNIYYVGAGTTPPPPPPAIVPGQTYTITAKNSGLLLDVKGASVADGASIQQNTANGGTSQKWTVNTATGGAYNFVNVNSGKLLDVTGRLTTVGDTLDQWHSTGGNWQQFNLVDAGNGYFNIIPVNSQLCLDVKGSSSAAGANIQQYTCNGHDNQKFSFTQLKEAAVNDLVSTPKTEKGSLVIAPNPLTDGSFVNVSFSLSVQSEVKLVVSDFLGRTLVQENLGTFAAGNVSQIVTLPKLAKGNYIVKILTADGPQTAKLICQ